MKFLIVGLGSMGKRRIRNLQKLGFNNLIGFDIKKERLDEVSKKFKINTISNIENAIKLKPDIMIISTPPDLHLKYVTIAVNNNIHFFTELNLISKDVEKIIKLTSENHIQAKPSCTMLFNPLFKEIKKIVQNGSLGKIYFIRHHTGQYLPDWHPWENYRNFFVSKKETGGAKEMVAFELIWLTEIFSDISTLYSEQDKISDLDTDIDDIYQIMIKFKNNVRCNLIVDVVSKPAFKECIIIGEKGSMKCDFVKKSLSIYKNGKWTRKKIDIGKITTGYSTGIPSERIYEEEIKSFIQSVNRKKKYPFDFITELKILKYIDTMKLSSMRGKKITN